MPARRDPDKQSSRDREHGSKGHPNARRGAVPKGRLEAFSDGVFAIVITLLVLDLEIPGRGTDLREELLAAWPAYLAYLVSFAFIGGAWIAHTTMTRFTKAADAQLMRLNLVLLLFVSFLPFTTSVMATYLNTQDEQLGAILFGVNLTLAGVLINALLAYAARRPGLADHAAEEELRRFEKDRRLSVGLQAAATVLAVFWPLVSVLVFLGVSLLILIDPLLRAPWGPRGTEAA